MFPTIGRSGTGKRPRVGLEDLCGRVVTLAQSTDEKPELVLIGGPSRSGKSWLAEQLCSHVRSVGCSVLLVGLDAWIVSLEKRKTASTVMERYDRGEIAKAVRRIMQGQTVYPPVYDPVTRRRIREQGPCGYSTAGGVVVVEGVIALALEDLLPESKLRIFVDAEDEIRHQRLYEFYRAVKGLGDRTVRELIQNREAEEVRFIRTTYKRADCMFDGGAAL